MALTNLRNELASVERLARQTSELRDSARIAPPPRNTRMNVTTRCLRRQKLGLSAIAYGPRLVRSASNVILARFQEAPTIIRNIIVRVERGFADFAQIPYEDPLAQRELLLLLDEFAAECGPTVLLTLEYQLLFQYHIVSNDVMIPLFDAYTQTGGQLWID
jgi:hypothetical protein